MYVGRAGLAGHGEVTPRCSRRSRRAKCPGEALIAGAPREDSIAERHHGEAVAPGGCLDKRHEERGWWMLQMARRVIARPDAWVRRPPASDRRFFDLQRSFGERFLASLARRFLPAAPL